MDELEKLAAQDKAMREALAAIYSGTCVPYLKSRGWHHWKHNDKWTHEKHSRIGLTHVGAIGIEIRQVVEARNTIPAIAARVRRMEEALQHYAIQDGFGFRDSSIAREALAKEPESA